VLRQTIHGSGGAELAAAIRERLSDRSVALARTPAEERELLEKQPGSPSGSISTRGSWPPPRT